MNFSNTVSSCAAAADAWQPMHLQFRRSAFHLFSRLLTLTRGQATDAAPCVFTGRSMRRFGAKYVRYSFRSPHFSQVLRTVRPTG